VCHQKYYEDNEFATGIQYFKDHRLGCEEYVECQQGHGRLKSCPSGLQLDTATGHCWLLCHASGIMYFIIAGSCLLAVMMVILGLWLRRIRQRVAVISDTKSLISDAGTIF
ncbi:hypothetical protein CAPTEDRAFT_216843, partial [Capitella teleta]